MRLDLKLGKGFCYKGGNLGTGEIDQWLTGLPEDLGLISRLTWHLIATLKGSDSLFSVSHIHRQSIHTLKKIHWVW